ncbi:MAG: hypothetical protein ACLFQB_15095, partial [Chitinispirillaceae bacterium]
MVQSPDHPLLAANIIELHYWFDDETHTIDALVQNRCESELLALFREIASPLNAPMSIETFPLAKGGVRRSFKVIPRKDTVRGNLRAAFVSALASEILVTPLSAPVIPAVEKVAERFFGEAGPDAIKTKKLLREIEKLREDILKVKDRLSKSTVIKKRKSNFYDMLNRYRKVCRISFSVEDSRRNKLLDEAVASRQDFSTFVLVSDNLDPVKDDKAEIEIISPVLKQANYRWVGLYKGSPVSFSMKCGAFSELVRSGEVQFRNGTIIRCLLQIRKKIDSEGLEKIMGYDVLEVYEYYESGKPGVAVIKKPKV